MRSEQADALQGRLQTVLDAQYPAWQVRGLHPLGGGLENMVFAAESEAFGAVAIRVPWTRQVANINDPAQDARETLRQEAEVARHLAQYGVPVPAVHALHLSDELDFLVSALIVGDGSPAAPAEMGRVAAAIHRAPPPALPLVCMEGKRLPEVLAERIARRARQAGRLTGEMFPLPSEARLREVLDWAGARTSLLHMDLRPANFLTRNGQVLAVVDWGNALLGDPALDVARAAENGEVDMEGFLAGYGEADPFDGVPEPVELLCRLDTAVMLVGVFLEEAPAPALANRYIARTGELVQRLRRAL